MTVRTPIYYDGTDVVEMNATQINEWKTYIAYLYGTAPSVTVTVVGSSGTLSPTMADTRLQAGAAITSQASAFANEDYKRGLKTMKMHLMEPAPSYFKDDRIRFI